MISNIMQELLIGNSNPTIISTTGIIEGPAKPREYYLDLNDPCFQPEELRHRFCKQEIFEGQLYRLSR